MCICCTLISKRDFDAALPQGEYSGDLSSATVATIVRRPWVPAEEIKLKSGSIVVGYTLSTKDKWFVVLKEYDRTINYIAADDVASRTVCSVENNDETAKATPLITFQGVNTAKKQFCKDVR